MDDSHKFGHLWVVALGGSNVVWGFVMVVSSVLIYVSLAVMWSLWRRIHAANGALVTDGPYARVRHPQYVALVVLVAGFLLQWPTILTVLMAPVLIRTYVRLARREERELAERFDGEYRAYAERVPAFIPRLEGA